MSVFFAASTTYENNRIIEYHIEQVLCQSKPKSSIVKGDNLIHKKQYFQSDFEAFECIRSQLSN